ncbi:MULTISPECIES: hypothetical protein [unclassified Bradyrhizobium]|uniref:hypothetical protein n=1 Tax=unclassified Bradyrhizobium TaxID=2631580 RepID=UPI001FF7100B|nr:MULTISPECIES: hypothetical protein [unclassified Bradyrhizobium]MCK1314011.1 hypothetical protein [Bradyrhizobium sp. 23]MCK1611059.1 hypothetical protein [Bradyrhizobium sp. 163]MCK1762813.1 hypothetical protein [Bradyrhizobium sp. 136]
MSIEVNVRSGEISKTILNAGDILIVRSDSNWVSGVVRDASNQAAVISPNSKIAIGPYPDVRQFSIEAAPNSIQGEPLMYSVGNSRRDDATEVVFARSSSNVRSFSASFTLDATYDKFDLVYNASTNVTVTVPANLPQGFKVKFIGTNLTGNITIAAGAGATNRDGQTTLASGKNGTLTITRQSAKNDAAQYALSGDFA